MDKQAARAYIIESARRHGVDPAVALSIWEQESGGSTDLSLRGQTIERGKWTGHYARGPWQIMSFHGEIPDSFEGQTDWALQHLKERGVRGYYGEGAPGVAGHPSTDQYEAQVLARAGRTPTVDVRTAAAPGLPPQMQIPGDPITGRAQAQAQMNGTLPPEIREMPEGAPQSFGSRLAENPWLQMGISLLGSPGYGGNLGMALGHGLGQGLLAAQNAEQMRQQRVQNQTRNQLWQEQLANERTRLLSPPQLPPGELIRARLQQAQIANAARELDLREKGLYNQPAVRPTGPAEPRAPLGYRWTQGGNLEAIPGGPADRTGAGTSDRRAPLGYRWTQGGNLEAIPGGPATKATAGATAGKEGGQTDSYLTLIGDVEELAKEIDGMTQGTSPLGTVGAVGARLSAWAGIADQLLGTAYADRVRDAFGGMDPAVVRRRLQAAVLPVARLLVEPKGPLSENEQDQAKRLVGVLDGEGPVSAEQAMEIVTQTLRLAKKAAGTLPPEMDGIETPLSGTKPVSEMTDEELAAELRRLKP